jgi:hypothetical protein
MVIAGPETGLPHGSEGAMYSTKGPEIWAITQLFLYLDKSDPGGHPTGDPMSGASDII